MRHVLCLQICLHDGSASFGMRHVAWYRAWEGNEFGGNVRF